MQGATRAKPKATPGSTLKATPMPKVKAKAKNKARSALLKMQLKRQRGEHDWSSDDDVG